MTISDTMELLEPIWTWYYIMTKHRCKPPLVQGHDAATPKRDLLSKTCCLVNRVKCCKCYTLNLEVTRSAGCQNYSSLIIHNCPATPRNLQ